IADGSPCRSACGTPIKRPGSVLGGRSWRRSPTRSTSSTRPARETYPSRHPCPPRPPPVRPFRRWWTAGVQLFVFRVAFPKDPAYKSGIALTAANLAARSGDQAGAYSRYQQILSNYPDSQEAYGAMQVLLKAGTPVDDLLRGEISFNSKDYNDAITALYAYTG